MDRPTVDISESDYAALQEIARIEGKSVATVLSEAIRFLRRETLLAATNSAYAEAREDSTRWADAISERLLWDSTLGDGLDKA